MRGRAFLATKGAGRKRESAARRVARRPSSWRAQERKGGVASSGAPEKVGWGNTMGAGAVWSWGATRGWPGGAGGVRRACRQGAGKLEVGDESRGNFVNKSKFKNQFCNFKFSPSSGPQMKKC